MNMCDLIDILMRLKPDAEAITQDSVLMELGVSSLDMMILICELEQFYDLAINVENLKCIKTVNQLYQAVKEQ